MGRCKQAEEKTESPMVTISTSLARSIGSHSQSWPDCGSVIEASPIKRGVVVSE